MGSAGTGQADGTAAKDGIHRHQRRPALCPALTTHLLLQQCSWFERTEKEGDWGLGRGVTVEVHRGAKREI